MSDTTWVADALCAQTDPEAYFPVKGGPIQPALRICARCPVQQACLDYALEHHLNHGVWGGTTPNQRRHLTKTTTREEQVQ